MFWWVLDNHCFVLMHLKLIRSSFWIWVSSVSNRLLVDVFVQNRVQILIHHFNRQRFWNFLFDARQDQCRSHIVELINWIFLLELAHFFDQVIWPLCKCFPLISLEDCLLLFLLFLLAICFNWIQRFCINALESPMGAPWWNRYWSHCWLNLVFEIALATSLCLVFYCSRECIWGGLRVTLQLRIRDWFSLLNGSFISVRGLGSILWRWNVDRCGQSGLTLDEICSELLADRLHCRQFVWLSMLLQLCILPIDHVYWEALVLLYVCHHHLLVKH